MASHLRRWNIFLLQSADDDRSMRKVSLLNEHQTRRVTDIYVGAGRRSGIDHCKSRWSDKPTSAVSMSSDKGSSRVQTMSIVPPASCVVPTTC